MAGSILTQSGTRRDSPGSAGLPHAARLAMPGSGCYFRRMSITAIVQNNTIKLPPGVDLPDGTEGTIAAPEAAKLAPGQMLAERLAPFVGCVHSGVRDLASNHE